MMLQRMSPFVGTNATSRHVRLMVAIGWIVLQKSKVAEPRIFRENTKQERVADSYTLNRVIEVACEFNAT